jgi:hypothetical protein
MPELACKYSHEFDKRQNLTLLGAECFDEAGLCDACAGGRLVDFEGCGRDRGGQDNGFISSRSVA